MKNKIDIEEILKYLAPFLGFYYISKSVFIAGKERTSYYFIQSTISFLVLVIFLGLISGSSDKKAVDTSIKSDLVSESSKSEAIKEVETEYKKDPKKFLKRIDALGRGNGRDWVLASQDTRDVVCMDLIRIVFKTEDVEKAVELCRHIDIVYIDPKTRTQTVAETGFLLAKKL